MLRVCQKNFEDTISSVQGIGCFAVLVSVLCSGSVPAEQLQLNIHEGWVMHTGDNRIWAKAEFDDKEWKSIQIGTTWEEAGFAEYDGYAWYRVRFVIPEDWSQNKSVEESENDGFLILSLGPVDDADVTYFNGLKIGATGTMPPNYASAYSTPRKYKIPTAKVRWGESNLVAVRVYDQEGVGLI